MANMLFLENPCGERPMKRNKPKKKRQMFKMPRAQDWLVGGASAGFSLSSALLVEDFVAKQSIAPIFDSQLNPKLKTASFFGAKIASDIVGGALGVMGLRMLAKSQAGKPLGLSGVRSQQAILWGGIGAYGARAIANGFKMAKKLGEDNLIEVRAAAQLEIDKSDKKGFIGRFIPGNGTSAYLTTGTNAYLTTTGTNAYLTENTLVQGQGVGAYQNNPCQTGSHLATVQGQGVGAYVTANKQVSLY